MGQKQDRIDDEEWYALAAIIKGSIDADYDERGDSRRQQLILRCKGTYVQFVVTPDKLADLSEFLREKTDVAWVSFDPTLQTTVEFVWDDEFDDRVFFKVDVGGGTVIHITYGGTTLTDLQEAIADMLEQIDLARSS